MLITHLLLEDLALNYVEDFYIRKKEKMNPCNVLKIEDLKILVMFKNFCNHQKVLYFANIT